MQHDHLESRAQAAREAGLMRLRRATRVSILGATALAGAFAAVVAHSSPGHKSRPAATPAKRAVRRASIRHQPVVTHTQTEASVPAPAPAAPPAPAPVTTSAPPVATTGAT